MYINTKNLIIQIKTNQIKFFMKLQPFSVNITEKAPVIKRRTAN